MLRPLSPRRKRLLYLLNKGWVGYRAGLDALEKGKALSRFSSRWACRCADIATSSQQRKKKQHKGLRIEQREV